jgi:hypothetical protein
MQNSIHEYNPSQIYLPITLLNSTRLALCVLCFIFLSDFSTFAQKNNYALEINNLDIKKKDKNTITLVFDLNNIGEEDIELPYQTPLDIITVHFEETQKSKQLVAYRYLIEEKLAKQQLTLPAGLVKSAVTMKFPLQKKEIYREKEVLSETPKTAQLIDTVTITKPKDDLKIFTQDSVLISHNDAISIIQIPLDWALIDSVSELKIPLNAHPRKSKKKENENITTLEQPIEIIAKDTIIQHPCVNFVIDSIWVVKQKNKNITLAFYIKNIGNQAVRLWGETPESSDNLAVKAYLSSFDHYVNSAYFLRGLYLQDEANAIGGILDPQQRIKATMEINLKDKTKFTPYILLEINALQNIEECETGDNFKAIRLN